MWTRCTLTTISRSSPRHFTSQIDMLGRRSEHGHRCNSYSPRRKRPRKRRICVSWHNGHERSGMALLRPLLRRLPLVYPPERLLRSAWLLVTTLVIARRRVRMRRARRTTRLCGRESKFGRRRGRSGRRRCGCPTWERRCGRSFWRSGPFQPLSKQLLTMLQRAKPRHLRENRAWSC